MTTDLKGRYTEVRCCRICGNPNLVPVLDLGMPALAGVFPESSDEEVPKGPLGLVKCVATNGGPACGLVQLRHTYEASEMYGDNYGYRSGLNASMVAHLQGKARRIKQTVRLEAGDLVLDIGSNDSTFLREMREPGVTAVGMDPTGTKFRSYYPIDIQLIADFFSAERFHAEFQGRRAKVVTSFSMFYDLDDPLGFMRQIENVLADDGIWVFEQSYLPSMLAKNSYDTVCQEHLEYYALRQILFMARLAGLKVVDVEMNNVNGGSFSIVAVKRGSKHPTNAEVLDRIQREESDLGLDGLRVFEEFASRVSAHRSELKQFLAETRKQKLRLFGYGASTKGNVILQYCGVTRDEMPCIAEVNQDKFGAFTPGTRIPIVSEQEARRRQPDAYLVLPWHFRDHILKREESFLNAGHKIVFPLPQLEVVALAQSAHHR